MQVNKHITIITGGAGFIGSNIAAKLEKHVDREIIIADDFGSDDKWQNLKKRYRIDIIPASTIIDFIEAYHQNIYEIIHMGAISATTEYDVDLVLENNFTLSKQLWHLCTFHQIPFIYASSGATYGQGEQGFLDSEDIDYLKTLRPMNPYGWSKHLFDLWVMHQVKKNQHPPQWVGLKFFNVYGPNEYHKGSMQSVIAHFFPQIKAGEPIKLFKSHHPNFADGEQARDFIYVKDCANIVLWLSQNPQISGLFNLGTGKARTFLDLAHNIYHNLNKKPDIKFIDTPEDIREHYQYYTQSNMEKFNALGYDKSFYTLESGIQDYVLYYLNQEDPYL